jgi:hypothetical protein
MQGKDRKWYSKLNSFLIFVFISSMIGVLGMVVIILAMAPFIYFVELFSIKGWFAGFVILLGFILMLFIIGIIMEKTKWMLDLILSALNGKVDSRLFPKKIDKGDTFLYDLAFVIQLFLGMIILTIILVAYWYM